LTILEPQKYKMQNPFVRIGIGI